MAAYQTMSHCPRCDTGYIGEGDSAEAALVAAKAKVRDHLVKAQGADLDEGLHDFALEQWDNT